MGIYKPNARTMLFGKAGAGKTALAVSSFWDWKEKKQVANGKLITFGEEDNPALEVPQEFRETELGTSMRLTSPLLDDDKFREQWNLISQKLVSNAQKGDRLDVLVIDGLTEFDLLFEETYVGGGGENNFAKWNDLLSEFYSMMMRVSSTVLGCHVIMTARAAAQRKHGAGDELIDGDLYPSVRGAFKYQLPHYFNMVLYMETVRAAFDGRTVPAHALHVVGSDGSFLTKNVWEHKWLEAGHPDVVLNHTWGEFWDKLTGTMGTQEDKEGN